MDNALVFDRGEWPWSFVFTLWVGDGDLVLDRFRDDRVLVVSGGCIGGGLLGGSVASASGDGDGGKICLLRIDRVLTPDRVGLGFGLDF